MIKVKLEFLSLLIFISNCSTAQRNVENVKELSGVIQNIENSKLVLFSKELIEACADSTTLSFFKEKIDLTDKSLEKYSEGDKKESWLTLKLLYDSIENVKSVNTELNTARLQLLDILKPYKKLFFKVDDLLIFGQLDNSKRSLINGYDEGSTSESRFIFFLYDPLLLRDVLIKHGMNDKWKRMGIFLCNHIRENDNPMSLRVVMQNSIRSRLNNLIQTEDINTIKQDLDNCSISTNRND